MADPLQQKDPTSDGLMVEDEGKKITEEGDMANRPTIESSSETEDGKKPVKLPPESKEEKMDHLVGMNELGERCLLMSIEEFQRLRRATSSGDSIREKSKEAKLLQEMLHQERSYGNRNGAIGPAGTSGRP